MTIYEAVALVFEEYDKVKDDEYTANPISFALYMTWQKVEDDRWRQIKEQMEVSSDV